MRDRITVTLKTVGKEKWADLNVLGLSHEFCGEQVRCINEQFSFAGGHRVRLYSFRKNVHWRITTGFKVDISEVTPAQPPADTRRKRK